MIVKTRVFLVICSIKKQLVTFFCLLKRIAMIYIRPVYFLLSFILCTVSFPLSIIAQNTVITLSDNDVDIITQNTDEYYIYLGKELSNFIDLISQISDLDKQNNSPINTLKKHIEHGHLLAEYNVIIEVLEYIEKVLQSNSNTLNHKQFDALTTDFDFLMNKVLNGSLTIDSQVVKKTAYSLTSDNDMTTRAYTPILSTYIMNENLNVRGKTTLNKHLNVKQGAHIQGKLKVNRAALFKKNAAIKGTLSVADLTVTNCMNSLCVNSLSVVDLVAEHISVGSNTLSAADAVIESLLVNNEVLNGALQITSLSSPGVIHNDTSGLLFSSLIVDEDIATATITNDKLVTISHNDIPENIVVRDSFGNFATNMITLNGVVTNATDVTTKAYVDSVVTTGIVAKTPALVVATTNMPITGLYSIDGVSLSTNDRVLLAGQTNAVENGLWLAQSGAWIRPTDFATGSTAGQAYALILSGTIYTGSSWLCNTPAAVIDTDPIYFVLFSLADATTGANVGTGIGRVFKDKTGNTLNFKSFIQGSHILITNNAYDITLTTDGTTFNTPNTIVTRDASGNFSAGVISASLNGNASTATTATNFSGSLSGDVTGTQGATVVSFVGGQTAANVAAATVLANAATTANTASTIVKRNASGNFTTNMITLNGTTTNATDAATKAYVDAQVGGTGTSLNTPNTLVLRDNTGSFAAQVISITDGIISGNLNLGNSTSTSGNIKKNGNSFIHNFGTNNTFVGVNAGNFVTSGTGQNSGFGINTLASVTTGSNNIAIGYQSGQTLSTGNGNIYINAAAATTNENSTTRIGTSQTACFIAGIAGAGISGNGIVINNNGQLGITLSSKKFKHNIEDIGALSANILNLRPVTFVYNDDTTEELQFGLIAEEVDQQFPAIVAKDGEGNPYTIRYHVLPVLLLNELQKLHAIIEQQQSVIEEMQKSHITVQEMNQAIALLREEMQLYIK